MLAQLILGNGQQQTRRGGGGIVSNTLSSLLPINGCRKYDKYFKKTDVVLLIIRQYLAEPGR